MKFNLKVWLTAVFAACFCGAAIHVAAVSAEASFTNVVQTEVSEINNESGLENYADAFIMVLSKTDYMTSPGWEQGN